MFAINDEFMVVINEKLMVSLFVINDELMVPMELKVCQFMIWHKLKHELITIFEIIYPIKNVVFLYFILSLCQLVIELNFN